MRAGDLHDKMDIYSVATVVNSWGDFTRTEAVRYANVRCSVLHMGTPSAGASEFTDDDQRVGETCAGCSLEWRSALSQRQLGHFGWPS